MSDVKRQRERKRKRKVTGGAAGSFSKYYPLDRPAIPDNRIEHQVIIIAVKKRRIKRGCKYKRLKHKQTT